MSSPFKLDWSAIVEAMEALDEAGWEKDQALDTIAELLDETVALDAVLPAPVGSIAEALDGPAIRAVLGLAWDLVHGASPEKKAARKARRKARRLLRRSDRRSFDPGDLAAGEDPTPAG